MAKKLSMVSIVLSLVAVLVLVYFFRPQTFNFLIQGFYDEPENYDEGFEDDFNNTEGFARGKKDPGVSTSGAPKTKTVVCPPGCVPAPK